MTSSQNAAPRPPPRWPEIDLGRGIAGALMITNHAGVEWLGEDAGAAHPAAAAATFVGSLAPVLFFTLAGLGRGVQAHARARARPFRDALLKAGLLVLADAALWLTPERHLGLDFLGFIALSSLALELLSRASAPRTMAAAVAVGALLLRYAVAPRLGLSEAEGPALHAWHLLSGDGIVPGVSYPLTPWIAFPLVGYLLGGAAATHADWVRRHRGAVSGAWALAAALGLGACAFLQGRGWVFFRWGNVSFAYCVLAFASVAAGLALMLAVRSARLRAALSLDGPTSFVLVPLHYAAIGAVAWLSPELPAGAFFVLCGAAVAGVFALSRAVSRRLTALAATLAGAGLTPTLLRAAPLCLTPLLVLEPGPLRAATSTAIQLLACFCFVLHAQRAPARSPQGVPSVSTSSQKRSA